MLCLLFVLCLTRLRWICEPGTQRQISGSDVQAILSGVDHGPLHAQVHGLVLVGVAARVSGCEAMSWDRRLDNHLLVGVPPGAAAVLPPASSHMVCFQTAAQLLIADWCPCPAPWLLLTGGDLCEERAACQDAQHAAE